LQDVLLKSNPLLLFAACIFFILSKILSAYRLNLFFSAVGIFVEKGTNLRLYLLGMFYNLFLPGGIGGDGYKVYYLRHNMNASVKKSLLALIFDRVTGLVSLGVLSMFFGIFIRQSFIREIFFILAIAFNTGLFYYIVHRWFRNFFSILNLTNLQSIGVQVLQVISAWLILKAIGYDHQMSSYLFVFLISSVVAAIPFTVGGVGAREITFLYASGILKLDLNTSVVLSLLFFLITALVSAMGIMYIVRPGLIAHNQN
jgi:uncharacterized membrane protein YbhN (UPF0104 family)